MAPYPLDKQTDDCNSPHNWLMSLAMDLAVVLYVHGGENETNGCHLTGFSEDVAFACYFMALHLPLPSHHARVLVVLATPVRKYLNWWKIQLATYLLSSW